MPINKEWIKSAKKSDLAADNYGMLWTLIPKWKSLLIFIVDICILNSNSIISAVVSRSGRLSLIGPVMQQV
jgi:hypothetical protein